jgi:hypothetical protein
MSAIPFEIESINFVGDWNYMTRSSICTICNTSLYKPAPEKNKKNFVNYSVSVGECKHAFHRKCIKKFSRTCNLCPNPGCPSDQFKFVKELETKNSVKLFKN